MISSKFLIQDIRKKEDFTKTTFSGFKKNEVLKECFKSCDQNKIENACNWIAEIHCSDYVDSFWEKMFIYISEKIHINSYNLPSIIWNHYSYYNSLIKNEKDPVNSQRIRNSLFECIALCAVADRSKSQIKKRVIKDKDFNTNTISKKLSCNTNHIPSDLLKSEDPKILTLVINEFCHGIRYHKDYQGRIQDRKELKREQYLDKVVYWIYWIHKWEQKNGTVKCYKRNISGIDEEYHCNVVWILWSAILKECALRRPDSNEVTEIVSLYNMYKYNFSSVKKASKITFLIHAVTLLILDDISIKKANPANPLVIQAVMKCNYMYEPLKKYERKMQSIIPSVILEKPKKEKKESEKVTKKKVQDERVKESMDKLDMVFSVDTEVHREILF